MSSSPMNSNHCAMTIEVSLNQRHQWAKLKFWGPIMLVFPLTLCLYHITLEYYYTRTRSIYTHMDRVNGEWQNSNFSSFPLLCHCSSQSNSKLKHSDVLHLCFFFLSPDRHMLLTESPEMHMLGFQSFIGTMSRHAYVRFPKLVMRRRWSQSV